MSTTALIIFVKNPEKGKVKTRLAQTIGDDQALAIYQRLLQHTRDITHPLSYDCFVFYSQFIDQKDEWDNAIYQKRLQVQGDLGIKMKTAFQQLFQEGYQRLVIIGSDCLLLTPNHIQQAFQQLHHYDVVLGPAKDGGYYLLGMKTLQTVVFDNQKWSTSGLLHNTIVGLKGAKKTYALLETLSDIDYYEDLPEDWVMSRE